MTTQWETVRVFISSTFDDMHAERDYLVKQVFPELREWCERRKLRLVDIDLRWGVKEEDTQNKNVVEVCLRRIDEARPFFLCFLGQRRGWVPREEDISPSTLEDEAYPDLKELIGKTSVTEMEILHALVNPFHRSRMMKDQPSEYYDPVKYVLFYLRDASYLEQLPRDFPSLRKIYTNEGIQDEAERAEADQELNKWVKEEIPTLCEKHGRPKRDYTATWNPSATSPELLLPLACPSLVPDNVSNWQKKWADAGIEVKGTRVEPASLVQAEAYNHQRSRGRLTRFEYNGMHLSQIIIEDLQAAISERYPEHIEISKVTDLQNELDQQEQFLFTGSEGFIERGGDFDELDSYVKGESNKLFVLTAPAGMGKSSLLAKWVDRYRTRIEQHEDDSIHFRFIGQSDRSTAVYSLLHLLLQEIKEVAGKLEEEIPDDPQKLRQEFLKLLESIGKKGKTVIVLDALNQLETDLSDLTWLPYQLPENIKLIVSFKRGEQEAESLLGRILGQVILSEVKPFENLGHRQQLVNRYLEQYLKQLDQQLLDALINLPSASNPLYLKIVLSELRIFGAFANLSEKIRSDFGESPVSAFNAVLKRLEDDPAYSSIDPKEAVPLLFGLLAHARHGLSVDELSEIIGQVLGKDKQAATDTIHLILRQVRPFLAHRDGRYDFFFESFKSAALERFVSEEDNLPKRTVQAWHHLLANYFKDQPLVLESETKTVPNRHKLYEQPYQQAYAGMEDGWVKTVSDYWFMEAKIGTFGTQSMIEDYDLGLALQKRLSREKYESLRQIQGTLRLSTYALTQKNHQLAGQLYGRLLGSNNPHIESLLAQAGTKKDAPWMRPLFPSLQPPKNLASTGGTLRFTLYGHFGWVKSCAFSPDGKRIVSASLDETLRVWDSQSGIELMSLKGHTGGIRSVALSHDAKWIVSASNDKTLKIWDADSGIELKTLYGHTKSVRSCAFSPDGKRIVSASDDDTLKVWDAESGAELRTLRGHTREVISCLFSLDGKQIISASKDKTIKIWDVESGINIKSLEEPESDIDTCSLSPDGMQIISGSCAEAVIFWDIEHGVKLKMWTGEKVKGAFSLALSPNAKIIVSSYMWGGDIKVLDAESGDEIQTLLGHTAGVTSFAFSPDGKLVVSASDDDTLKVWDIENIETMERSTVTEAYDDLQSVKAAAWVLFGSTLPITEAHDEPQPLKMHSGETGSRSFSLEEKSALPVSTDKTRGARNRESDLKFGFLFMERKQIGAFELSWDNKQIALVKGHRLSICDIENGTKLKEIGMIRPGNVVACVLSPNGKQIGIVREYLHSFEIYTSQGLGGWFILSGHEGAVTSCAFSPNGKWVASTSIDGKIRIWDIESRDIISQCYGYQTCAFSPDSKLLVSASDYGTLKIWDVASGHILRILSGHTGAVTACVFSSDGKWILSASLDSSLMIWDTESGAEIRTLSGHNGHVVDCAFSLDSKRVVSAGKDRTLRIWDVAGREIATFIAEEHILKCRFLTDERFVVCYDRGENLHILEVICS